MCPDLTDIAKARALSLLFTIYLLEAQKSVRCLYFGAEQSSGQRPSLKTVCYLNFSTFSSLGQKARAVCV
jgi:hypothetical protein